MVNKDFKIEDSSLTNKAMIKLFGVSEDRVSNWKCGRTKIPDDVIKDLKRIEKYIDNISYKYI